MSHLRNTARHLRTMVYKSTLDSSLRSIKSNKSSKSLSSLKSVDSLGYEHKMMKILPIRALQDNFMYLLIDNATKYAAAVDPVNASAMSSAISDQGVELKAVLTTHHHHDHSHGNSDMIQMFPGITIYGGDNRVQALNKHVDHNETIRVGSINIECFSTPCHTKGHICYYATCEAPDQPGPDSQDVQRIQRAIFTGDTLFIAGCGRFFEGSAEQMYRNMNIFSSLPDDTKVYCGHEYTVANLKFALSVEPHNADIKNKLIWAQNKIALKEPTVPSTIGEEKKINPFMRVKKAHVKKYTGEQDEVEVTAVLRQRKNEFQP